MTERIGDVSRIIKNGGGSEFFGHGLKKPARKP